MAFLSQLDVSVSALAAQRLRTEIIQHNVANANTTRTEEGGPYRRQIVVFGEHKPFRNLRLGRNYINNNNFGSMLEMSLARRRERQLAGVQATRVVEDPTPFTPVFDPTHPDANEEGYYYRSNVDVAEEMMDLIAATRSYEANINVFEEIKNMTARALTIGR
jgi:flagellar basal-body rod protein FlgC